MSSWFDTHEVTNQPPPLVGHDAFATNRPLVEAVERICGPAAVDPDGALSAVGRRTGSEQVLEWARAANQHPPQLRTHDRYGHRIDVVDYHPAYHELMTAAVSQGLHAAPWADPEPFAHTRRAAAFTTWYQGDAGHTCPISMTYSAVPALRHEPSVAKVLEPLLTATSYDPRNVPGDEKAGITFGMAMTEKQGGSDVRSNRTTATPIGAGGPGGEYRLTGHKWFCSAPMSDGFLTLAQAPGGLSCFWMPRWCPDGSPNGAANGAASGATAGRRNPIRIQRLKDKLGDRSNASSEIEMLDTWAVMVGDEGRGVRTIIEMVNHTRLDCALGSASIMRNGVAQATWHTHHRRAFDAPLDEQALMSNVLADLCVESEAATLAVMRLASTFDRPDDSHEQLLARLLGPVVKYWTCKRAPQHAVESLECFGGVGYVEESDMPRLFRQSPVNGIWEGSGNVICLDVLRAMGREPASIEAFRSELELARGADRRFDDALDRFDTELADLDAIEHRARRLVESMALLFEGSLVLQHSPAVVADAFCGSRLDGGAAAAAVFGTLPAGIDTAAIVDRHRPTI